MSVFWSRLFGNNVNGKQSEISTIDLLSGIPLFEEFSKRELAAVERILHRREYNRDELIFRQGERGLGMYIVKRGRVLIVSEPDRQQILELKDGDFFGEMALLDDASRSATAIAATDCSVFGFFQPDLFELIAHDSQLGVKIVLRLARYASLRLRLANDRIVSLSAELLALQQNVPTGKG
jgi:CRP-like cAMP-binding protein